MANIKIDKFRRFGFSSTAYVTGDFESFSLYDKSLIKDCNFNLNTDSFKVRKLDDMFNGCVNASFTHSLSIGSDCSAESASRMFLGCTHASLPSVDIGSSNLKYCDSMFEGCSNAVLDGIEIPSGATAVSNMFKGCRKATFDDIEKLNENASDYSGIFSGCTNGSFRRLHILSNRKLGGYNMQYMFYGCSSLNSDNLYLENISDFISKSDYMFYGAGTNGAESFDDCVLNFGKLLSCTSMFDSSNFSFSNCYLQFYGKGRVHNGSTTTTELNSISRLFYNTCYVGKDSPTVVLGDLDVDDCNEMDSSIDSAFGGHYSITNSTVSNGITDFSEAYAYSSLTTADLRGISNNTSLDSFLSRAKYIGVQNFSSMFKDCRQLETIYGYIPPHGYTYKDMFSGCSSLKLDISKAFRKHYYGWSGEGDSLETEGNGGDEFETYHMSSIAGMFHECSGIYSSSDDFDLASIVKTVNSTLVSRVKNTASKIDSFRGAFSKIRIATGNTYTGLGMVYYDIDDISSKYGIVRYNSFDTDFYETSGGTPSEFGVNSSYMKYMFTEGYYRYGGVFMDDITKMFFLIETPSRDESDGDVTGFSVQTLEFTKNAVPHGFSSKFNSDRSKGYWNDYEFDRLYAARIYDTVSGEYIGNKFVGPYTRIYKENRIVNGETVTVTNSISMPVTIFDVYSSDVAIQDI